MKTTKKDFALFEAESRNYIKLLGLVDWSLHYAHELAEGTYAQTHTSLEGRVATIVFSTVWDDLRPKNETEIKRLALHETLHVLLAPMLQEAKERYTTPYVVEQIEHDIIRRLENTIVVEFPS